jgi:hypothetical protein
MAMDRELDNRYDLLFFAGLSDSAFNYLDNSKTASAFWISVTNHFPCYFFIRQTDPDAFWVFA